MENLWNGENLYLHYNPRNVWLVSSGRFVGTTFGLLASTCRNNCPESCTFWAISKNSTWVNDRNLTIQCQVSTSTTPPTTIKVNLASSAMASITTTLSEGATIETAEIPKTTRHISTSARDIPETTFEPALYFKSNIGENCQADQIIDTEDTCKVAANVLGLSYVRVRPNSNSYCPAGCHWPSSNSDVAFFNLLTDPFETYPQHFGVKGGLCKRTLHSNLTKSNDLS